MIYFSWTNVNGDKETFGENEKKWFKKMREAMGESRNECIDCPEINAQEANTKEMRMNFQSTMYGLDLNQTEV